MESGNSGGSLAHSSTDAGDDNHNSPLSFPRAPHVPPFSDPPPATWRPQPHPTPVTGTTAHPPPATNPKKRSRASRRAPTTVMTTDTSNFRAMVQSFTGVPAAPFAAGSPSAAGARLDRLFPPNTRRNPANPQIQLPTTDTTAGGMTHKAAVSDLGLLGHLGWPEDRFGPAIDMTEGNYSANAGAFLESWICSSTYHAT